VDGEAEEVALTVAVQALAQPLAQRALRGEGS
jgi:hypothetical protein